MQLMFEHIQLMFLRLRLNFRGKKQIEFENIALRSQLALFHAQVVDKKLTKPKVTDQFRRLWI